MGKRGARWRPQNQAEAAVRRLLEADGFRVTRRGWPDFLAIREGKVRLVEVKRSPGCPLRRSQQVVYDALAALGVHVEVLCPPEAVRGQPPLRADRLQGRTQATPYQAAVS